VSESVYLKSPDGIGFEVHADRPTGKWTREGAPVAMDTLPLDLDGLTKAVAPSPLPPGAEIGHIHMRAYVDLDVAVVFYRRLGMAAAWKTSEAVFLGWAAIATTLRLTGGLCRGREAPWRPRIPPVSRPARDPRGWSSSPLGKNYQVRTILASAAYS